MDFIHSITKPMSSLASEVEKFSSQETGYKDQSKMLDVLEQLHKTKYTVFQQLNQTFSELFEAFGHLVQRTDESSLLSLPQQERRRGM